MEDSSDLSSAEESAAVPEVHVCHKHTLYSMRATRNLASDVVIQEDGEIDSEALSDIMSLIFAGVVASAETLLSASANALILDSDFGTCPLCYLNREQPSDYLTEMVGKSCNYTRLVDAALVHAMFWPNHEDHDSGVREVLDIFRSLVRSEVAMDKYRDTHDGMTPQQHREQESWNEIEGNVPEALADMLRPMRDKILREQQTPDSEPYLRS